MYHCNKEHSSVTPLRPQHVFSKLEHFYGNEDHALVSEMALFSQKDVNRGIHSCAGGICGRRSKRHSAVQSSSLIRQQFGRLGSEAIVWLTLSDPSGHLGPSSAALWHATKHNGCQHPAVFFCHHDSSRTCCKVEMRL